MLLSTVNFSHSISRFGSCRLSLHAQNTVKSWIPLFTWLSPRQCSALFSCPIKCNLSLVCLFFSLYYLVPLYLSFLVLLDLICGSHFCLISSLTLFYSLTQVCPFLKKLFFTLFRDHFKYFLSYLVWVLTRNSARAVFRVYRYNKSHWILAWRTCRWHQAAYVRK